MSKQQILYLEEEYDYKQLLRLLASLLSKQDKTLSEFAFNSLADVLVDLDFIGRSFLTQDNYKWIREYLKTRGKALFTKQIDLLSQMVMRLQKKDKEQEERQKQETKDFEKLLEAL